MRLLASALLVVSLVTAGQKSAQARDLTGIYAASTSGAVLFFNLTDVDGQLTGYVQDVSTSSTTADGVSRSSSHVTGISSGSRLVLDLATGAQWTADLTWSGFILSIPLSNGQIQQLAFHRSSVTEVNELVMRITGSGNTWRANANAQAELNDATTRLNNDENVYLPQDLTAIQEAKARLAQALADMKRATEALSEKQAIAAEKHAKADEATRDAQTDEDRANAGELQGEAGAADGEVGAAHGAIGAAQGEITSAQWGVESANRDLTNLNARIAQLKGIISRDRSVLGMR